MCKPVVQGDRRMKFPISCKNVTNIRVADVSES